MGRSILACVLVCLGLVSSTSRAGIIGTDDRGEWFEASPKLRALGRSTAAILSKKDKLLEDGAFTDRVLSHGEADGLCSGVRYREQPAPADCTGFLVGEDLFVTAAHCLVGGCENLEILFDFYLPAAGKIPRKFSPSSLYTCREVVRSSAAEDWAVLRLDRPTRGRDFLRLRQKGQPAAGTPLVLLGFPRGIPLKIAGNATVKAPNVNADEEIYFEADVDSFGGNSGSPVVNARTGEVEGIHTTAFGEFEEEEVDPLTGKKCRRLRHFVDPADATPSWSVRATRVRLGKAD